jgi:hypothetical protein
MIYSTDSIEILSANVSLASEQVTQFTIIVDCKTGEYLYSTALANIAVEARLVGEVSWTNLETTPIDLTSYNGTPQRFEIRLTADSVSSNTRVLVPISVGRNL